MKQLNKVKFPDDFTSPDTAVAGDKTINDLISLLRMEPGFTVGTADTLVMLTTTGDVEVYKLVASCEVEVNW